MLIDALFASLDSERRAQQAVQAKLAADVKAEAHRYRVAVVEDWPQEADEALLTLVVGVMLLDDLAVSLASGG